MPTEFDQTKIIISIFIIAFSFYFVLFYKSYFLKIISFILAYPVIHMLYLYNGGAPLRILEVSGYSYYSTYIPEALFAYTLGVASFHAGLYKAHYNKFELNFTYKFNQTTTITLIIILIISNLITYPWLFGLSERREGILPGNGWVAIYIGTYLTLALSNNANNKYIKILLYILPIYLILGGERVNNIMFVFLLLMIDKNKKEIELKSSQIPFIFISILVIFSAAYVAGNLRSGLEISELNMFYIFNYITAMEALHVYFASFWHVKTIGHTPEILINMTASLVPFNPLGGAGSPYFFENLIAAHIPTVGGGMFFTEGNMVAGIAGVVFWGFALGTIIKKSIVKANSYWSLLFIVFFLLAFRVFWYGWVYILTPFYISAIYLFLIRYLHDKNRSRN